MRDFYKGKEPELLKAAQAVVEKVESGMDPTTAVVKVAEDFNLTSGRIRLLCQAYNNGAVIDNFHQFKEASRRFQDIPLADPDEAIFRMTAKRASAARLKKEAVWQAPKLSFFKKESVAPVNRQKIASALQCLRVEKTENKDLPSAFELWQTKQAADHAKTNALIAEKNVVQVIQKVAQWCADHGQEMTDTLHSLAAHCGGSPGHELMRVVRQKAGFHDCVQAPKKIIKEAERQKIVQSSIWHDVLNAEPLRNKLAAAIMDWDRADKKYIEVKSMLKTSSTRMQQSSVPATNPYDGSLIAPERLQHADVRRLIKAKMVLNELLSDPTLTASARSPREVAAIFEDISRAAPHVIDQPELVKALVERRLQSHTQPFESSELVNLGRAVQEVQGNRDWRDAKTVIDPMKSYEWENSIDYDQKKLDQERELTEKRLENELTILRERLLAEAQRHQDNLNLKKKEMAQSDARHKDMMDAKDRELSLQQSLGLASQKLKERELDERNLQHQQSQALRQQELGEKAQYDQESLLLRWLGHDLDKKKYKLSKRVAKAKMNSGYTNNPYAGNPVGGGNPNVFFAASSLNPGGGGYPHPNPSVAAAGSGNPQPTYQSATATAGNVGSSAGSATTTTANVPSGSNPASIFSVFKKLRG